MYSSFSRLRRFLTIIFLNRLSAVFLSFLVFHWVSSWLLFWIFYLLDFNLPWLRVWFLKNNHFSFRVTIFPWLFMVLDGLFSAGAFEVVNLFPIWMLVDFNNSACWSLDIFFCFPVDGGIVQVFVFSCLSYLLFWSRGGESPPGCLQWWVSLLCLFPLGFRAPPLWWKDVAVCGEPGSQSYHAIIWVRMATGTLCCSQETMALALLLLPGFCN